MIAKLVKEKKTLAVVSQLCDSTEFPSSPSHVGFFKLAGRGRSFAKFEFVSAYVYMVMLFILSTIP